jgi:hypothetical protein
VTKDANDILMGSGAPAAKFDQVGAILSGTVLAEPEATQQTDFRTKVAETWKDGSPKMQVLVRLATTLRDPERADDDGERTLYIKGKHLTDAIRQAVRASGANGIHPGGTLTVQYVADGPAEVGLNPPKLYAASYVAPAVSFNGVSSPAQQQIPAQPTYVAPQPAYVAPAPAAVMQQQVPAAAPAAVPTGVDPAMWGRLDPEQRQRVLAAMAPVAASAQHIPF